MLFDPEPSLDFICLKLLIKSLLLQYCYWASKYMAFLDQIIRNNYKSETIAILTWLKLKQLHN